MLSEDELRDAVLLIFANKQVLIVFFYLNFYTYVLSNGPSIHVIM